MVQRSTEAAQFQAQSDTKVRGSSTGATAGDFNKNRTGSNLDALPEADSSSSRLLTSIMGTVGKLANQYIQQSQEEAYLTGAAKAGTIQSEKELEGNIFTQAWAKGGYRDTMGRVAIADNEARIIRDMPKMREASPEQYNEYIAERRAELMPSLEGMTRQQRGAAFQNLLLNDRAAIKKHSSEHMKFQVEVENRSVQAAVKVKVAAMEDAKANDDASTYRAAVEATYATANSAIIQNPKLTEQNKAQLLTEFMQAALESDHYQLYEMAKSTQLPMPDGTTRPMSSILPWDEEVKLSKAYRGSLERKEAERSYGFTVGVAQMRADWDNPDTPLQPESEVRTKVEEGVRRGFYKMEKVDTIMQDYYKAGAKKSKGGPLAAAYAAGDTGKIMSLNATDNEALEAWLGKYGKNLSPADRVNALTTIGITHGRPSALVQLGKDLAPALAQLGSVENMDPANALALASTLKVLDAAERGGQAGVFSAVISSYPTDMQAKVLDFRENLRLGMSPDLAIKHTVQRLADFGKMDAQTRAAMAAGNAKEDAEIISGFESRSFLDTITLKAKSVFSTGAANSLATRTGTGWWEDAGRVAEVGASMKFAAAEELRVMNQTHPFMTKDARATAVTATLAGRTIDTANGPLLVPRGQTVQSFFGVPSSTGAQRVGAAMDEFVKTADGNRLAYSVQDNKIMFRELSKTGQFVRGGVLDPKQIAPMVAAQQDRESEAFRVTHGGGRSVKGVNFNGDNTAGLDNVQVFNMRQHLLTADAFATSGKGTPAETKAKADYFKVESDKAATAARLPMRTTGLGSQEAFNFFSEIAFRTGGKSTSDKAYRPMYEALRTKDNAAAIKGLGETPLFKAAPPAVQQRMLETINRLTKG